MIKKYFILILLLFLVVLACNKSETTTTVVKDEVVLPDNPYDEIDYGITDTNMTAIDSSSFLGLHKYIFSTKCAQAACHDGAFEPDFRTVQSSYSTTVLHPVLKNYPDGDFIVRVAPGDTTNSWLHERITTDDSVLGRMPLYDELSDHQIKMIEKWIMDGAPDIFGNSPEVKSLQPTFAGMFAVLPEEGNFRVDTNRSEVIEPFATSKDYITRVWFGTYDFDAEGTFLLGDVLTYNKVKFSKVYHDFSDAIEMDLQVADTSEIGPAFNGEDFPYFHYVDIDPANFDLNQVYFMRIYVQDADHDFPTEIPAEASSLFIRLFFSFAIL